MHAKHVCNQAMPLADRRVARLASAISISQFMLFSSVYNAGTVLTVYHVMKLS